MSNLKKLCEFIDQVKDDNGVTKYKENLIDLIKAVLTKVNKEIDGDDITGLDDTQMWAVIGSSVNSAIIKFKEDLKLSNQVSSELDLAINKANKQVFGLGKKRTRQQEDSGKEDDFDDNDNEEPEDDVEAEEEEDENNEDFKDSNKDSFNEDKEEDELEDDELEGEEEEDEEEEDEEEEEKNDDKDNEVEEDMEEEEEDEKEDLPDDEKPLGKKAKGNKKEKDHFFSMADLNQFADQFEEEDAENEENGSPRAAPNTISLRTRRKEEKEDSLASEEAEVEAEEDSNESLKYNQFFDAPEKGKGKQKSQDEENDIFSQIKEIEEKMLSKKEWNMKGEVLSKERPKESLLSNPMDFEVSIRPVPIPDKTYTQAVENMIKNRIKDDLFDDPVRKERVNLNKKQSDFELNFTKDRKGLGELYEDEYTGTKATDERAEEIKKECDLLCEELYGIFDKLTNLNFAPHNIKGKAEITVSNVPAIQIEEIGNYVSENKSGVKSAKEMLDTKMIKEKTKDEMTKEEKQNVHNRKKRNLRSRIHHKEKMKKMTELTQKLGSKFEAKIQMKAEKEKLKNTGGNEFKSSKVFGKINEMVQNKSKISAGEEPKGDEDFKKYKL